MTIDRVLEGEKISELGEDTRPCSRERIGCGCYIDGAIENFHLCESCAIGHSACDAILKNGSYTPIYRWEWDF